MGKKNTLTRHNARSKKGSSKGFKEKHDDRDFPLDHADNIHEELTKENIYWSIDSYTHRGESGKSKSGFYFDADKANYKSFTDTIKDFYEANFKHMYDAQQERYRKKSQYKYMKTFDEWRSSRKFCPEWTHMQIGNMDDHGGDVPKKTLDQIFVKFLAYEREWSAEHNDCFTMLTAYAHGDEAVRHWGDAKVWHYKDDDGNLVIGQEEALKRAGVPLPHPEKKEGHYNNRKMTYDRMMRDKLIEICEEYGVEIDKIPDPSRSHQNAEKDTMIKQKRGKLKEEVKALEEQKALLQEQIKDMSLEKLPLSEIEAVYRRRLYEAEQMQKNVEADLGYHPEEARETPLREVRMPSL